MRDVCLLVSSSDNTFDVFSKLSDNIVKKWPIKDIDIYVGLNCQIAKLPYHTVSAVTSDWRTELGFQLNALPDQYNYIILILDDFFFYDQVNLNVLKHFISVAKERDIDCLRLKPQERSGLGHVFLYIARILRGKDDVVRLSCNEPYYTSLQVAIWKRSYLSKLLSQVGSIWEFEHKVENNSRHFALAHSFLRYEHLVEKGKWFKYAPDILGCQCVENFKERGFEKNNINLFKCLNKLKFFLFGYLFLRLRRFKSSNRCACEKNPNK